METIRGYVDHIVFRNRENGYTVLDLICDGEDLTCVGIFSSIDEGESVKATGKYIVHPTYGRQFQVESYEVSLLDDAVSDRFNALINL